MAFDMTPDVLRQIENMAGRGATMQQISDALGIARSTLYEHKNKNEDVEDAIRRGKAKGVIAFTDHLFQQSKAGKTAATIFALINLDPENWKQRPPELAQDAETVKAHRVQVEIVDARADADPAAG